MMNQRKKWLAALGVITAMAASGIAMAASPQDQAASGCRPSQMVNDGFRGGVTDFRQDHIQLLKFLKMEEETFRAEMRSGKTLAEIAKDRGISETKLTDFLTQQMTQHIDEGVKAGRLTAEQAEKMKTDIARHIADMIHGKGPIHNGPGPRHGLGPFEDAGLLELLHIDKEAFQADLRSGQSLLAIAGKQGVSEQQLKDYFTSQMTQHLEEDVQAGRLSAEKAQEMKDHMSEHINDLINGKGPMRGGCGPLGSEPPKE